MVEISLYSSHLPPQGARFPARCVTCGEPCDTSAERPIEVGGQSGAIQAFLQNTGPQQRVPVHLGSCLRRLRREHFREHAVPLLLLLGVATPGLLLGLLAGVSASAATLFLVAVVALLLPLNAWLTHRHKRVFSVSQEMDEKFNGLFTYQFSIASLADEFEELNRQACFRRE